MAQFLALVKGLVILAGAQASDVADRSMHQGFLSQYMGSDASKTSLAEYNKFVTPRFESVRGEPLITKDSNPPKIVDKQEERAVQKVLATDSSMSIGMSAIGVSLLALAAMLGVRMRRGLQQAATFASSGGHESDMSIALAPAAAGNILELNTQESTVRRQVGWSQQSSKNLSSLTLCYATPSDNSVKANAANASSIGEAETSTGEPFLQLKVPWGMHKFGGASLANAELYRNAGDILIAESTSGGIETPTAAIVSAMKGMTDLLLGVVEAALVSETAAKEKLDAVVESQIACVNELLEGHSELSESINKNIRSDCEDIGALLRSLSLLRVAPNTTSEFVAGMGEIWSAQVLCAYLKTQGVPTACLNARDILVVESNAAESGVGAKGAALDMRVEVMYGETAKRLDSWWAQEASALKGDKPPIVVVTGFVACTMEGVPTTLKRSGSDYSATIFAKLFKASQVTLWKNVDGVYSADPRVVPEATSIKDMSYDEAIELAYFGGQVIHPTAMLPLMEDDTPMYVRNAERPAFEGTKITREGRDPAQASDKMSESPVKFVTSIPNIALVNIDGGSWGSVSKLTRRAMGAMEDAGVKIVLLTQACASHSVSLAVDESEGKRAVEALQSAFELELTRGDINGIINQPGYSIISTIGDEMRNCAGTLAKIAAAVARCGISMSAVAQGTDERNVAFVIEKSKLELAMSAVHEEFTGTSRSLVSDVDDVIVSNWKQAAKEKKEKAGEKQIS